MKHLKRLQYLTLCLLLVPCLSSGVNAKASKKAKALKAYQTFLAKGKFWSGSYSHYYPVKFKAVDLNNDKVPELLVDNENYSYGDGLFAYYAYVGGKVKLLHVCYHCEFPEDTQVYVKGKKSIYLGRLCQTRNW